MTSHAPCCAQNLAAKSSGSKDGARSTLRTAGVWKTMRISSQFHRKRGKAEIERAGVPPHPIDVMMAASETDDCPGNPVAVRPGSRSRGNRVQDSVFECELTGVRLSEVKDRLGKLIDRPTGRVHIYPQCETCFFRSESMGKTSPAESREGCIALRKSGVLAPQRRRCSWRAAPLPPQFVANPRPPEASLSDGAAAVVAQNARPTGCILQLVLIRTPADFPSVLSVVCYLGL